MTFGMLLVSIDGHTDLWVFIYQRSHDRCSGSGATQRLKALVDTESAIVKEH